MRRVKGGVGPLHVLHVLHGLHGLHVLYGTVWDSLDQLATTIFYLVDCESFLHYNFRTTFVFALGS